LPKTRFFVSIYRFAQLPKPVSNFPRKSRFVQAFASFVPAAGCHSRTPLNLFVAKRAEALERCRLRRYFRITAEFLMWLKKTSLRVESGFQTTAKLLCEKHSKTSRFQCKILTSAENLFAQSVYLRNQLFFKEKVRVEKFCCRENSE